MRHTHTRTLHTLLEFANRGVDHRSADLTDARFVHHGLATGVYAWRTGDDLMVEEETAAEAETAKGKEKQLEADAQQAVNEKEEHSRVPLHSASRRLVIAAPPHPVAFNSVRWSLFINYRRVRCARSCSGCLLSCKKAAALSIPPRGSPRR